MFYSDSFDVIVIGSGIGGLATASLLAQCRDHHRVLVDHVEEHTIRPTLESGFWAGMTLYPVSKCTPARAADMVEMYGPERLMVNSAGDWGPSKPTAVPDFILEMRRRGHPEILIRKIVYDNPLEFFGQSDNFNFIPPDVMQTVK